MRVRGQRVFVAQRGIGAVQEQGGSMTCLSRNSGRRVSGLILNWVARD